MTFSICPALGGHIQRSISVAALALLFAVPAPARAQEGTLPEAFQGAAPGEQWREPLRVESRGALSAPVGIGLLVTLDSEVIRVVLADDEIARVQVISPHEVLLTGLVPGRTSVHVWLADGRRLYYTFQATRDLDLLRRTLRDLDPRISVSTSPDALSVVLEGEVADAGVAREALQRARAILARAGDRTEPLSLLSYPGSADTLDDRLQEALQAIDPRIRVRRVQVGDSPEAEQDTFVLEGRVRDIHALKRAVTLAERQLGGTGSELVAAGAVRLQFQRYRGFTGGAGGGGGAGDASTAVLRNATDPPAAGLSAKVARGLVVTSESGRVVSFLEVDELPQVLVSIRVVEVDRTKAKKAGINFRFDNGDFSIGNYLSPQVRGLPPGNDGGAASVTGLAGANLVAAFVDDATSVLAAIDFLEDKALARSVAEPNILTLTGESASVVVGGEVPVPTTAVNQVTAIQGFYFQDFGVRLDIRPTVVDDDLIVLEVLPSIIRRSIALGVGDVPGFQVQSVQTTTRVQTGQSLVLGGLLSFEEGLEQRKIPGLGWLPGLGRWQRKSRSERELLFIISPRIIATPRAAEPPEPLEMPDLDEVELPELEWPEDRQRWRDEFEPLESRPDGVPPSFIETEPPVVRFENDGRTEAPGEAEGEAPPEFAPPEAAPPESAPPESAPPPAADDPELLWADLDPEVEVEHEPEFEPEFEPEPEAEPESEPEVEPEPPPLPTAVVAVGSCLNLRPEPGTWSPPVDCLPPGTRVEILGEDGIWRRIRLEYGDEGWVVGSYLALLPPEEASEAAGEGDVETQLRRLQDELERLRESQDSGG